MSASWKEAAFGQPLALRLLIPSGSTSGPGDVALIAFFRPWCRARCGCPWMSARSLGIAPLVKGARNRAVPRRKEFPTASLPSPGNPEGGGRPFAMQVRVFCGPRRQGTAARAEGSVWPSNKNEKARRRRGPTDPRSRARSTHSKVSRPVAIALAVRVCRWPP